MLGNAKGTHLIMYNLKVLEIYQGDTIILVSMFSLDFVRILFRGSRVFFL